MPTPVARLRKLSGLIAIVPIVVIAMASAMHLETVAAAKDATHSVPVPVPVLVELFTSEGCSSCPPADALLARLDAKQPVAGARVIALSEHVTYWNSLGWRDPYSSEAMTQRQQQYSARFGLGEVYTPQAVVDGAAELVGSDERGLTRAIVNASKQAKSALTIEHAAIVDGTLKFSLKSESSAHGSVFVALAQDSAESTVSRGENGGRVLHHVAVVRSLEAMGKDAADGRELMLKLPANPAESPMRLVIFLIDPRSGHVMAIALRELNQ